MKNFLSDLTKKKSTATVTSSENKQPQHASTPIPESTAETADKTIVSESKPKKRPLSKDIAALLVRIAAMAAIFLILFSFVFMVFRSPDDNMFPSVREGDMVIAYRLDKKYAADDVVAFDYQGKHMCGRVVAVAGDTVNFDKDGFILNGNHQYEPKIFEKTLPIKNGVTFPLKVPEGEIFVLGDARASSTDSRVLGCIKVNQTEGKVIAIFRRRNL